MEQRGLRVNMEKTKVMNCKVRQGQAVRQRTREEISMWNLQERCWKKLDMLHKMKELDSQKV